MVYTYILGLFFLLRSLPNKLAFMNMSLRPGINCFDITYAPTEMPKFISSDKFMFIFVQIKKLSSRNLERITSHVTTRCQDRVLLPIINKNQKKSHDVHKIKKKHKKGDWTEMSSIIYKRANLYSQRNEDAILCNFIYVNLYGFVYFEVAEFP